MDATPASGARGMLWGGRRGGALLVILGLFALLPGLGALPPVDRDESRFAQASKQMLESGTLAGWAVPKVGARPRLNKPPLIYWFQAASAWTLGERGAAIRAGDAFTGDVWVYRIPSVLAAIIASLLTWRLGCSMWGAAGAPARGAWLAGALLVGCAMVMWDARQARADQLLLAVTTGAMAALWRCWSLWIGREASPAGSVGTLSLSRVLPLWVLVGVGVMTKGPITPMVVILAAVGLAWSTRRWRFLAALRPVTGLVLVLAIVLPWVVVVGEQVGWARYLAEISDEVLGRSVSPSEGHWGPPGYHLVLLPLVFWPGSLLTAAGVALAFKEIARRARESRGSGVPQAAAPARRSLGGAIGAWRDRARDAGAAPELFLLAWIVPSWLVFEAVSTKLPHYTMPLFPAIALVSARAVIEADRRGAPALGLNARGARAGFALWVILGLLIGAGAWALGWVAGPGGPSADGEATRDIAALALGLGLLPALFVAALALAAWALTRERFWRAQLLTLGTWVALGGVWAVHLGLARARVLWSSSRVSEIIAHADPDGRRRVGAWGYAEDSLVFLTHGRLERIGREGPEAWARAHPGAIAVIASERGEAHRGPEGARLLGEVSGFNYSKGQPVELGVWLVHDAVPVPAPEPGDVGGP